MTCLECVYHGPPVSDYRGARPCDFCITVPGYTKKQKIEEVAQCQETNETAQTGPAEPSTAKPADPGLATSCTATAEPSPCGTSPASA